MADERLIEIMAEMLHEVKGINGRLDKHDDALGSIRTSLKLISEDIHEMKHDINEMKEDVRKLNLGDQELRLSVMKLSEEVKVIPDLVHRLEVLEKKQAS